MSDKLSISVTDLHARMIEDAVASGEYASASEVVRDALRRWRVNHAIDLAVEEGVASGFGEADRPITAIKSEAKRGRQSRQKKRSA